MMDSLTPEQFRSITLESADAEGRLDPPSLADPWVEQSLLIGMYMEGLIDKRGPERRMYNRSGPWYITAKGRAMQGSEG